MRMNLPFRMKDVVPSLYDHWIAGDMITYMLVAAGSRKRADIIRIINRPKRYIALGGIYGRNCGSGEIKRVLQG